MIELSQQFLDCTCECICNLDADKKNSCLCLSTYSGRSINNDQSTQNTEFDTVLFPFNITEHNEFQTTSPVALLQKKNHGNLALASMLMLDSLNKNQTRRSEIRLYRVWDEHYIAEQRGILPMPPPYCLSGTKIFSFTGCQQAEMIELLQGANKLHWHANPQQRISTEKVEELTSYLGWQEYTKLRKLVDMQPLMTGYFPSIAQSLATLISNNYLARTVIQPHVNHDGWTPKTQRSVTNISSISTSILKLMKSKVDSRNLKRYLIPWIDGRSNSNIIV